MKPVSEWNESYLGELIKLGVQESLILDYKGSASLGKDSKKTNDISKDVSSFANSAGGILVYGMLEDKHVPTAIDVGVDRNQTTKEWLESIIKSWIQPVVEDLVVKPIDVPTKGKDMVIYAVEIGAATSRAPHQAFDHRYYKRFNFESAPMEDYEVRDLMRRSLEYGKKYGAAWDLNVEVERLIAAVHERGQIDGGQYAPRARLAIGVSNALRSAGSVMALFPKSLRSEVAQLIKQVDHIIRLSKRSTRDGARKRGLLTD
jgi:hypothetical protein